MTLWLTSHSVLLSEILAAVVALDHGLAAIPAINANSTFQLITLMLGKLSSLL
jgi:hypothetical protein